MEAQRAAFERGAKGTGKTESEVAISTMDEGTGKRQAGQDPDAQLQHLKLPSVCMAETIGKLESSATHPDPKQRGFILAEEQKSMCKWFGHALDIAFDEETSAVPMKKRTQKA